MIRGTLHPVATRESPGRPGELERRLLRLLLAGCTVSAAARILHISTRVAESRLARLRECTGSVNLYGLGASAERLGWHDEDQAEVESQAEAHPQADVDAHAVA